MWATVSTNDIVVDDRQMSSCDCCMQMNVSIVVVCSQCGGQFCDNCMQQQIMITNNHQQCALCGNALFAAQSTSIVNTAGFVMFGKRIETKYIHII